MMAHLIAQSRDELIDRLASLPNHRSLVSFLRRHDRLWDPGVVEHLYDRVVRVSRVDVPQAERLAQAGNWIAEKLGDDRCRAQSLRAVGHVLFMRGKYSEALARYDSALHLFRAQGSDLDV